MNKEYNVLEMLLLKKKKYIVLFSGLKCSPVEKIINDLTKIYNAIDLNFLHLNLNDDISVINNRVNNLLKEDKQQPYFIVGKTFPKDNLTIPVDLHINISLNYKLLKELDNTQNLYEDYKKEMEKNRVNKYINLNKEYDYNKILSNIFEIIIDDIEKKVYGDKYDKLNHHVYNPNNIDTTESNESSKLVFDPNALSPLEKNERAIELIEQELKDEIEEDLIKVDEDDDDTDFLAKEIRMFGSGIK